MITEDDLFNRYFKLLGIRRAKPDTNSLREIVRAHLCRVPFENVSKLYFKKQGMVGLPSLQQFLDGIEKHNFGGTCYANNFHLNRLLAYLGFDVMLCGADMKQPDVHLVSIVKVEEREYLVDAGYAAPFLEPLPRDLNRDYVITLGNDRYVLRPQDHNGGSRMELFRDGALKHTYVVKPDPRRIEEFHEAIAESYRADATFMNALLLVRFAPGRSDAVRNMTYIESIGTKSTKKTVSSRDELAQLVKKIFFIPRRIVNEALDEIEQMRDVWK